MNSKPKKLILGFIPNNKCNLKCEYCYISQLNKWGKSSEDFHYPPQHIVKALSAERLGGSSLINLTGQGETLLYSGIVELTHGLLSEGHFVELVTNGLTTKVIEQVLDFSPEKLVQLEFKISFHYLELKKKNLLAHFFENVKLIKNSPASFSLELMPYDEIENCIEEINEICLENAGAKCHATIGRSDSTAGRSLLTAHTKSEFQKIWSPLESTMFNYKLEILDKKRREFCYAGLWSLYVDLSTGDARQCYGQPINQNIFRNLNKPILFSPVGYHCVQPYCINGHAFLTVGVIPELKTPTYSQIRNRVCKDKSEWLSSDCQAYFNSKLYESNKEFSKSQKLWHTIYSPFLFVFWALRNWNHTVQSIKVVLLRYKNRIHRG